MNVVVVRAASVAGMERENGGGDGACGSDGGGDDGGGDDGGGINGSHQW